MRIATVQMHDGPTLVVDVDGDYRRLDFDVDLLSLVQAGVDPLNLAVGDAVTGELVAPLHPGKIVAIEHKSGDYFLGEDEVEAAEKARAAGCDAPLYFLRVGSRYAHRLMTPRP